jgi:transposase-like protein
MTCPVCNSKKVSSNGTTPKGSKRYRCRDCGSSWSDGTFQKSQTPICPECGSDHTIKNGLYRRKTIPDSQNWKCQGCGNTFREPLPGETAYIPELGAVCPYCENVNTVKNGTSPRINPPPAQNHICKSCGRCFTTDKVA